MPSREIKCHADGGQHLGGNLTFGQLDGRLHRGHRLNLFHLVFLGVLLHEIVSHATENGREDEEGNEINYDIVVVKTSPFMIVGWAMQYGTTVEIMDEEIREKIREMLEKMRCCYEK